jgi:mRNA-degrading endonuclease RelE of RelBE toxin-antitoxin system
MSDPYEIRYAQAAVEDLKGFRAFDQRQVLDGIVTHLTHEPRRVSRSRIKAMSQPFWSQYRLRAGDFRVYYDVEDSPARVNVLRVLRKGSGETPDAPP